MPEYAGVTISLISQYDAATIPETHVRILTTPTLRWLDLTPRAANSPALSEHPDRTFAGQSISTRTSTIVEANVPVLPSSQFWIAYECPPPSGSHQRAADEDHGAGGEEASGLKYCYFKLVIGNQCVLSWGVGEQERWKGKMMFGLFDAGRDFEGRRIVEKRGLFFPVAAGGHGAGVGGFEIRVFRAKGRRREAVRYQSVGEVLKDGGKAVDLTSLGKVQGVEKRRWYTYALVDAVDEPWLTVRYRFDGNDSDFTHGTESTLFSTDVECSTTTEPDGPTEEVTESSLWTGLEQNTPPTNHSDNAYSEALYGDRIDTAIRRLSFPPRNQLFPSSMSNNEHSPSPVKQQASASDDTLSRPRVRSSERSLAPSPRRTTGLRKPEWTAVRTASPVEGSMAFEDEITSTAHKKSASTSLSGSSGLLRSVVGNALRRMEERSR